MSTLQCISPIDGSVFAERDTLTQEAARAAVDRMPLVISICV